MLKSDIEKRKKSFDLEKYKISKYTVYELGPDRDGGKTFKVYEQDKNEVLNILKDGSIKLINDSILNMIIKDLSPVYEKYAEYMVKKYTNKKIDMYYGYDKVEPGVILIGDTYVPIGTPDKANTNVLLKTTGFWYNGSDDIKKLIELSIPIIAKHIKIDYVIDSLNNGDFYFYLMDKNGVVYSLVYDATHDGDTVSIINEKRLLISDIIEYNL